MIKEDKAKTIDSISIRLASPERIKQWSYGEVTKPETINYRTGRSERGGLFDERVFGPEKDYECYCGKYRRIRYRDIVCEKCGVEVTKSIVRRERMGHIELASPVSHIWFLRGVPSRIGLVAGISGASLERVIYFAAYIITNVNESERDKVLKELDSEFKGKIKGLNNEKSKDSMREILLGAKKEIKSLQVGMILDEIQYHRFSIKYGTIFEAGIGAEAIYNLFKKIDLVKLGEEVEKILLTASAINKPRVKKRLAMVKSMERSKIRPEWMFLTVIPVTPPGLRPMVALEGGRHATSDVNDLYRRVINRNNRLKKLQEISAPDVILRNEKRILQEAVDALLDGSMRHQNSMTMSQNRKVLKSIADSLKGKQGLFRQNLLGKRVDYSGRSVIVVGPTLKLNQCGLPKKMALELFKPFVIARLLEDELAFNIRGASRLIEEGIPEVWAILEDVIKGRRVLLNRAPTLHRLGIQAFNPILIEGHAIQLHPLVCSAFNADFDGDQMAVHLPLSEEAQWEAEELMASEKNLLGPGTGEPIVNPSQDMVLGCYWVTKMVDGEKGEGKIFESPNSAISAKDFNIITLRTKIKVKSDSEKQKYEEFKGELFETTVGRLLFNSILPVDFPYQNKEINKGALKNIVAELIVKYGIKEVPKMLDKIKEFGFKYSTISGATWGMTDLETPKEKVGFVKEGRIRAQEVKDQFNEGLLSDEERYRKTIEIWQEVKNKIEEVMPSVLKEGSSVSDMLNSGARGTLSQVVQMSGMKGLIVNTAGETIDFPIIPSMKEGLSPLEYFVTTHGSRKGLADTALNTAKAGYLTRRLVYVADNAIITTEDCGTKNGRKVVRKNESGFDVAMAKHIRGRFLSKEIKEKNIKFGKGYLLSYDDAQQIEESGIEEVFVYSPLSCEAKNGLCQKCYGYDLGRNKLVEKGEPVGIVAAQAIGEPATQLTMRTFHSGGIASVGGDITQGLPRIEEIFEKRNPKSPAVISEFNGMILDVTDNRTEKSITVLAKSEGGKDEKKIEYEVPLKRMIKVKKGAEVKQGDVLTDGSANITDLFKHSGIENTENYIISEVSKIYELQGATIARKHFEVIIRQMFSRIRVKETGDTPFVDGEVIEKTVFEKENRIVKENSGIESNGEQLVLGITEVSLTTKSFLSSASFQNTSRILIDKAVKGSEDQLEGLKENVIIGNLIPAGTTFPGREITFGKKKEDES